jgi:hypothetical protein
VPRKAVRTQNESPVLRVSGPQLLRALRGGQPGNRNAVKSLPWLPSYDLRKPEGLRSFLEEVIKAVWTGELGTRAAGSLSGSLRLMFELCELPDLEKRISAIERANGVKAN